MARLHGMECDINIIEAPPFFFDESASALDVKAIEIPFLDEAKEELKTKYNIDFVL